MPDTWKPVHYPAESPYTRSGRVLNPAPGGWCPTRVEDGRRVPLDRYSPYRSVEACQAACDRLNHPDGGGPSPVLSVGQSEVVARALATDTDDEKDAA